MTVSSERRRAHVVMPSELLREIDALVGRRKRSQFIQEAVEEKLRRQRLQASLAEMAGSLAGVDTPGWETPEAAAEWVRALRRGDPVGVSLTPNG
jgi:Arc/MetJ-type ribon-helix-helix transcriptional regulator